MRQQLHVHCNQREHRTRRVTEHSLRARVFEMQGQLHQHQGAAAREKNSVGRLSVPVKILLSADKNMMK